MTSVGETLEQKCELSGEVFPQLLNFEEARGYLNTTHLSSGSIKFSFTYTES